MAANELAAKLTSIRERLARLPKSKRPKLRNAAAATQRARLAKAFELTKLPADVEIWFAAHDGQDVLDEGIDPDAPAFTWMSIKDALEAWRELCEMEEEIMKPWSRDWIPIATNGGGDFFMVVLGGKKAGQLITYYHDDRSRPTEARSLEAFVGRIDKALASVEESTRLKKSVGTISADGAVWKDAPAPARDELRAAPIGTAYHRSSLPYESYWHRVYVKMTKTAWIAAAARGSRGKIDVNQAIAEVGKRLQEKLPREWNEPLPDVEKALSDANVFPSDLYALEGRSPRKDPYFFRRRAQLVVE